MRLSKESWITLLLIIGAGAYVSWLSPKWITNLTNKQLTLEIPSPTQSIDNPIHKQTAIALSNLVVVETASIDNVNISASAEVVSIDDSGKSIRLLVEIVNASDFPLDLALVNFLAVDNQGRKYHAISQLLLTELGIVTKCLVPDCVNELVAQITNIENSWPQKFVASKDIVQKGSISLYPKVPADAAYLNLFFSGTIGDKNFSNKVVAEVQLPETAEVSLQSTPIPTSTPKALLDPNLLTVSLKRIEILPTVYLGKLYRFHFEFVNNSGTSLSVSTMQNGFSATDEYGTQHHVITVFTAHDITNSICVPLMSSERGTFSVFQDCESEVASYSSDEAINILPMPGQTQNIALNLYPEISNNSGYVDILFHFESNNVRFNLGTIDKYLRISLSKTDTVVNDTSLLAEPNLHSTVVKLIKPGEAITIIGTADDPQWLRVRLATGEEGWIEAKDITVSN